MKKGTLWKVLLIAALAAGLALFARMQTVRADNPTYYVYIDNHYLGEGGSNTGLYYVQKTHKVTNDSSSDWNAYYAPSSGKLYLRNYEGNRIILLQAHGSKPLVIVLEGTNHISTTDQFGITISTNAGIELDIHASTSGGSLTIDVVNYDASYCAGIEHSRSANSAETTFVQGTAALTIHAEGKQAYGICSGGTVTVMESASADVSVTYNEEAIGYSAAVYTTDGNLDVSTSGGVSFAAVARDSFANSGYGYAFYIEKTNK